MQFKNPEVLYFLFLLIIPVIVHLFQLQKFVETPFTNVALLQKISTQSRKSNTLKKWLILATRLLVFLSILFSFSQPYLSSKEINENQNFYIYLDNSLSLNTKGNRGNLLKIAAQDIVKYAPQNGVFSLQTNRDFYKNIDFLTLKKELLNLKNTSKRKEIESVILKISEFKESKTKTLTYNILISDFQNTYKNVFTNVTPTFSAFKLQSSKKNNISIDSVFLKNKNSKNTTVIVSIKNEGEAQNNVPIAIYNQDKLLSKQSFSIQKNNTKKVTFTLENQTNFLGKVNVTLSDTFKFDNTLFFSLHKEDKIKVLCIGNNTKFLTKIYTADEFDLVDANVNTINYNRILKQDLIVLNELETIPTTLVKRLVNFSNNGGTIVIIPSNKAKLNTYNTLLKEISNTSLKAKRKDTLKITSINFNHPIFRDVFTKKIENFQYPTTYSYFPIALNYNNAILSYENKLPFVTEIKAAKGKVFLFSSPLSRENSNFLKSPLIVPLFYNFGKVSYEYSKLYYRLDQENKIDIPIQLHREAVLSLQRDNLKVIPPQQSYQNKVSINTFDYPTEAGFYAVVHQKDTLQTLAFNPPKSESKLQFLNFNSIKNEAKMVKNEASIKDIFTKIDKKNEVQWLWKWFLTLAIVSLLLEILILKFYKP